MILYPVALILGMVSIFKRKVAAAAGILGLICWIRSPLHHHSSYP
jgi:hypothetical protein